MAICLLTGCARSGKIADVTKKAQAKVIRRRIRVWLAERDMTQVQLARLLGVSPSALSKVFAGQPPTLALAAKLEDIVGIPARDFAEVA